MEMLKEKILKEEKVYIKGKIKDENGKSKTVALHRFLLGIEDKKYKNFIKNRLQIVISVCYNILSAEV